MPTEYYKKQLENGLIYQDFVYEILARNGIMTVAYGSKLFQHPNCADEMQSVIKSAEQCNRDADDLMRVMLQKARVDPSQMGMFE